MTLKSYSQKYLVLFGLIIFFMLILLLKGAFELNFSEEFDLSQKVLFDIRFPKMISALLSGGTLALCGLLMQVYFRNALAGPFVLGVHSGSSLFVALFLMAGPYLSQYLPVEVMQLGTVFFSICGSALVLFLLLYISHFLQDKVVLLVIGLLFSHLTSGVINILVSLSSADHIKNYLIWTQGSFSRLSLFEAPFIIVFILIGIFFVYRMKTELNLLLMVENYSLSMGVSVRKIRFRLIFLTAILSGVITSFCGPISFVGILGPHIARYLFLTNNHRILIPASLCVGSVLTLGAAVLVESISFMNFPINALLGFLGAPFILFIILKRVK